MRSDDPLDLPAGELRLHALAAAGLLSPAALARGLALVGRRPSAETWYGFARVQLILLGTALAAVGAVFFVAANWDELGAYTRMGLLAALMAACTLAGGWIGLSRLTGRAAALAGGLLFGPLVALVGQTYQTGADAWELFAAWTVVLAAYALACRFTGAWALTLLLAVVTVYLWIDQGLGVEPDDGAGLWVSLSTSALLWLLALALAGREGRLAALAWVLSACIAFGHGAYAIVETHHGAPYVGLAWAALQYVATALYFTRVRRDREFLRLAVGFAAALVAVAEGELIFDVLDLDELGLFVMGTLLIVQGYAIGRALLRADDEADAAAEEGSP